MTGVFVQHYRAQWRDMDFNQHMANSAFLDYAGNTRFAFLDSVGFTAETFAERQIGPVILEDRVTYKREIRLLEEFDVDYQAVAGTSDGRRFKVRNQFTTQAHGLVATVESVGLWFDLATRRPIKPPPDLHDAIAVLTRVEDYEEWLQPPR